MKNSSVYERLCHFFPFRSNDFTIGKRGQGESQEVWGRQGDTKQGKDFAWRIQTSCVTLNRAPSFHEGELPALEQYLLLVGQAWSPAAPAPPCPSEQGRSRGRSQGSWGLATGSCEGIRAVPAPHRVGLSPRIFSRRRWAQT